LAGRNAELFQIQAFFLQAFPRNVLAVLGDFNELKGRASKPKFRFLQIFVPPSAFESAAAFPERIEGWNNGL
jgi:hypothetical protein